MNANVKILPGCNSFKAEFNSVVSPPLAGITLWPIPSAGRVHYSGAQPYSPPHQKIKITRLSTNQVYLHNIIIFYNKISNNLDHVKKNSKITKILKKQSFK